MNPSAPPFQHRLSPAPEAQQSQINANGSAPNRGGWGDIRPPASAAGGSAPGFETRQAAPINYSQAVPMPAPTFVDRNGSVISRMSSTTGPSAAQSVTSTPASDGNTTKWTENGNGNRIGNGLPSAPAVTGWFDGPAMAAPVNGNADSGGSANSDHKRDGTTDSGYHSPVETVHNRPSQIGQAGLAPVHELQGSQASQWASAPRSAEYQTGGGGEMDGVTQAFAAASMRDQSKTPVPLPSVQQQTHAPSFSAPTPAHLPTAAVDNGGLNAGSVGWGDPNEVADPAPVSNGGGWGDPEPPRPSPTSVASPSPSTQIFHQHVQNQQGQQTYSSSNSGFGSGPTSQASSSSNRWQQQQQQPQHSSAHVPSTYAQAATTGGWGATPSASTPTPAAAQPESNGWGAVPAPNPAPQNGYGSGGISSSIGYGGGNGYSGGGSSGQPRSNGYGGGGGPTGGLPPRSGLGATAPCLTGTNSIQLRKNRWGQAQRSEEEFKAMLEATEAEFGNLYSNVSSFDRYGYGDRGYGDDSGYNQDVDGGDGGQQNSTSGAGGGHGW